MEELTVDLQTCNYSPTGYGPWTHYYVRRQCQYKVTIFDTRTGNQYSQRTFYGSYPGTCPWKHFFTSTYEYEYGDHPLMDEVYRWLRGYVR